MRTYGPATYARPGNWPSRVIYTRHQRAMRRTTPFRWVVHDVTKLLPLAWEHEVRRIAEGGAQTRTLAGGSVTSREAPGTEVETLTVPGMTVCHDLPWLNSLYRGNFRELATMHAGNAVACATEELYGVVL